MVCFIEKHKADYLKSHGFHYIEETMGNKKVFNFVDTPELRQLLDSNFSAKDFFVSKYMNL